VACQGAKISADELLDAQMKRGALGLHMNLFHRDYDLLVTPTLSIAAFDAGKEVADKMLQQPLDRLDAVQLPFQPDAAAGGFDPVRADQGRPARSAAPRRAALRGRAGAARRAGFRES
jgi:Asp-tRNA(Asn)/Glu-tRNA(Gln) amidotransferase A subunit family amidase